MNVDFFLKFTKFHVGSLIAAEDFADKFNYQLTPMLLTLFITIIGIRQYVFTPIQCLIPKEFDKAWEEYTENYCWIQDTYFHSINLGPPKSIREREEASISYYQWVPFVLGAQALCFYLPHILWKVLSIRAGANVNQMIRFASDAAIIDQDKKAKMLRYLGKHMEKLLFARAVTTHPSLTTTRTRLFHALRTVLPCFWFRKENGFSLFALYIVVKFVYLSNCMAQLWLMQSFIGHNSSFFGPGILSDLLARRSWNHSGIFPRVTWCDFTVRRVGNTQRYSVQCVLPINMLNEKIYIFLWFWITCGIAIQSVAIVTWLLRMATTRERRRFIKKYLSILSDVDNQERRLASRFINQFLRHDGVFLLRMIAFNVGDLTAAELIQEVWNNWCAGKLVGDEKDLNAVVLPLHQINKPHDPIAPAQIKMRKKTHQKRAPGSAGGHREGTPRWIATEGPSHRATAERDTLTAKCAPDPTVMEDTALSEPILGSPNPINGTVYQSSLGSGSEPERPTRSAVEHASQRRLLKPDVV